MEVCVALVIIITVFMAVIIMNWIVNRRKRHKVLKICGIPGPDPDLLSGNLKEILSTATPSESLTIWLKKYGNVFGYFLGETPQVVIKDLDIIKQLLIKEFDLFCDRPLVLDIELLNKTLIGLRGDRWKEVRRLITPTFTSGKIKLMSHIINKKVDITVDVVAKKAESGEIFDIYELIQGLTLDVIADCALAMKTQCQANPQDIFLLAVRDYFRFVYNSAMYYAIIFPSVANILSFLDRFMVAGKMTTLIVDSLNKAIAERRKNQETKSMDLLQLMLDHREDEEVSTGLTDDEIIANAWVFLLAGFETTSSALAFTFALLIKHPDVQERLYREIEEAQDESFNTVQSLQYLDQVFSESLRLYPPVPGLVTRVCNADYQLGSFTIPKGAVIHVPVWNIHHDPEIWPDPSKFDPDRFSSENRSSLNKMAYMPFGIGRRNCIGARFAQAEAKLAIFRLVKNFRLVACEKTEDPLSLKSPAFITVNPANGVHLRAIPRVAIV